MAIRLEVFCSMCSKHGLVEPKIDGGKIDVAKSLRASGWIAVRHDDGNAFDVYCSKKCAA